MSSRVPWPRVLMEGAVIVCSILLALAADAWWDGRQDRVEERGILLDLRSEFVGHEEELRRLVGTTDTRTAASVSLLTWISTDLELSAPQLDSLWNRILLLTGFDAQTGAYDAVVNSGRLDLILDRDLRVALAAWPHELREVTSREAGVQDIVMTRLVPALTEAEAPINRMLAASWEWQSPVPTDDDTRERYEQLRGRSDIEGLLSLRYTWTRGLSGDYSAALRAAERVLALLDSRLRELGVG